MSQRLVMTMPSMTLTEADRAAAVLSLSLLGDVLLYATLPTMHLSMGISAMWVGILLSANRIVRILGGRTLATISARLDRRLLLMLGAAGAVVTTLLFAVATNEWLLLAARITWGAAFALLRQAVLEAATSQSHGIGRRLGTSLTITQLGPLVATTAGVWMATQGGYQLAFVVLGLASLLGVVVAMRLPASVRTESSMTRQEVRPRWPDYASFTIGLVVDGFIVMILPLLLLQSGSDATTTLAIAAAVQTVRQVSMIAVPPVIGRIADRHGLERVLAITLMVVAAGVVVAWSVSEVLGATLVSVGGAAGSTLIVGAATRRRSKNRQGAIALNTLWRDIGAATGALTAGLIAETASPGVIAIAAGLILLPAITSAWKCCHTRRAPIEPADPYLCCV